MTFDKRILSLLKRKDYTPLPIDKLASRLKVQKGDFIDFQKEVRALIQQGSIVRVKKDRLCLPRDADLVTGTIRFRSSGMAKLFLDEPLDKDNNNALIVRSEDTGVALHGDKVLARLVSGRRRFHYKKNRHGQAAAEEEPRNAQVIRILERAHESLPGTLQQSRLFHYVVPDDPRFVQDILVPDPKASLLKPRPQVGDKVIVRLDEWKLRHLNPQGEITAVLGKTHTPGAEYKALLHQYQLDPDFPAEVLAEVDKLPDVVSKKDKQGRLDLRKEHVFTIDPDDAKDFDDALHLERLEDGHIRVGIHIADVASYVRPGTELDREGRRRGNSTYLVGRVIPMLPHKLSNGLCSLVEAEDRLVKSVFLIFDQRGKVRETTFANSVIRSSKRLTYKQAYAFLKKDDFDDIRATPLPPSHQTGSTGRDLKSLSDKEMQALQDDIRSLWSIASRLRKARMNKGSLDLEMPETKIYVDKDGWAERLEKVEHDESHQLIEEFMLSANEAVARELRKVALPLLHRVHPKPETDRLDELSDLMGTFGIDTGDLTVRKNVTALLKAIRQHPQQHLLRIEFLRSQQQANYRATADGHYGLAKVNYTHFTSPIRRYSDLVVHRIFDRHLAKEGLPGADEKRGVGYSQDQLTSMGQHLSITERNSTDAERDSVKLKLLEFFERELEKPEKTRFEAVILDMKNHGFFVELTQSLAYGMVHISTLKDDLYVVDRDGTKVTGRRTRKTYAIGQTVWVVADRVDRFKRIIDFALADAPLERQVAANRSAPAKKVAPLPKNRPSSRGRSGGGKGSGGGGKKDKRKRRNRR